MRFFVLLIFTITSLSAVAAPMDSLRTERINGELYIIHKVDPQETLFALSRRYEVSVDEIKQNNPIVAQGLKVGDILRIPYKVMAREKAENVHIVKPGETLFSISKTYGLSVDELQDMNDLPNNALKIGQELQLPDRKGMIAAPPAGRIVQPRNNEAYQWHVVKQGETLFALSRQYEQDVPQIREWNNLADNSISIGDSLIVGLIKQPSTQITEPKEEDSPPFVATYEPPVKKEDLTTEKPEERNNSTEKLASIDEVEVTKKIVTNEANYEEMVETGLAELIENSGDTRKYLALHRTAKIGTIIRVKNEMNGREVFVRVLGKLPDTGINDKVLIKISQAAFDKLNAIDKRFRVKISYFPD